MAQRHEAQGRAGARPWPRPYFDAAGAAGRADGIVAGWPPLPDIAGPVAARIRAWVAAEVAPGRLFPWLPVAFAFGVVIYFTAEREPVWWVAAGFAGLLFMLALVLRTRPIGFPLVLGCAALAAGLAAPAVKARLLEHPILRASAYSVNVKGFVEVREERARSDRIVVRLTAIDGARISERPDRVRISVRKGTAPPVGAHIALRTRLNPPASPFRPGGYDLARDLYFRGIGATGLALGAIRIEAPPQRAGLSLQFATAIAAARDAIDARIRAAAPGDAGAIASALITGRQDALTGTVFDAMYISSLAHVLSVSGYHMALVAGVVFFVIRAGLALVPGLALRYPVKKWAAAVALVAAAFYLELSGAEVATQRSFIMTAVVLIGVLADRPTLTMRTLAVAALAVMLVAPEAVIHPSFQMSFAATLALIGAYQGGIPWAAAGGDTSLGARLALWGVREIVVLLLASLVAGLATTPYAAYHFHRMAPYGVIANLLAMPVISAVSMPAGLLALLAMPFGFDAPLWRLMGFGIDWMITVAEWVAHLPGAVGRIAAFGVAPLLLATAALFVLCLLRSPLRYAAAALAVVAAALAFNAPRPDVLVSAAGDVVAVRGGDKRLTAVKFGGDTLSITEWLAADGDERTATAPDVTAGFSCDPDGCVARLAGGGAVAVTRSVAGFADDCARAALIVTTRAAPPQCAAHVLDRNALRRGGATALTWRDGAFVADPARPRGFDRPWAKNFGQEFSASGSAPTTRPGTRPEGRDATPPAPDADAEE